jgi:hypothetical protein
MDHLHVDAIRIRARGLSGAAARGLADGLARAIAEALSARGPARPGAAAAVAHVDLGRISAGGRPSPALGAEIAARIAASLAPVAASKDNRR